MASPRNLDPKFIDATPSDDGTNVDETETKVKETDDEPMIVHFEKYQEGSVQKVKTHGPMPVKDWPAYERENGF